MTNTDFKIKIADYLLDIAKLVVAGVVVSAIFDKNMPKPTAILWGLIATLSFTIGGFAILLYSLKK
jgi:hypothetical protein